MKTILLTLHLCLLMLSAASAWDQGRVQVRVDLAHPKLPSDKKHTTYLKVGLTGLEAPKDAKPNRPPANVAIVLDRSGSMGGEKIQQAREAAVAAIERLGGDDIVSVIAFDTAVTTVVPATKLSSREEIIAAIRKIEVGGSTALFAGVSKGAEELRKFKSPQMVSRIVLLSDGQANVGPQSADELGRYGLSLGKEGISVTTIGLGLGYNEQLMAQLAQHSDGNHAFIKEPSELAAVFTEEFGDILSVVAQELKVKVTCPEGVRPVRVLGREASIRGGVVEVMMNQLRAGQEKYALLEIEAPAGTADQLIGDIEVSYRENNDNTPRLIASRSTATRAANEAEVEKSAVTPILVEVAKQIGVEKQMIAVKLSDEGKVKEAEKIFLDNARTLREQGERWKSSDLYIQGNANMTLNDGNNARGTTWQTYRNAAQTMANTFITQNGATSSNTNSNAAMLNNGQAILVPGAGGNVINLPSSSSGDSLRLVVPSGSTLTVPGTIKITPPASK
ncbi:MAG: VWA domain-containing protein [Verrucomicrobiaceae bacterium]|nr:VWA domain-containing protein [Verrucomicrobiaceae bacterium]